MSDSAPVQHPYDDRKDVVDSVLRRLELDVTMRLDGLLHGDYRGLVPGHGSEPGETREYEPGDDPRRIDWNVTARMQKPYIRQTIADRELETAVAVDLSPRLDFGTASCEKRDLALAAVAAVGFLTARIGNRFGVELIRPEGVESVPSRQGRAHLLHILEKIRTTPRATGTTDLAAGLSRLSGPHRRRGLRVIVSDFLAPTGWQDELARLTTRHEVLAIEVIDPRELELPDVGFLSVVDPATGRLREVATGKKKVRDAYAAAAKEQRDGIAQALRRTGTDHLTLRTDRDWLLDVVQFVAARRKRNETRPPRASR